MDDTTDAGNGGGGGDGNEDGDAQGDAALPRAGAARPGDDGPGFTLPFFMTAEYERRRALRQNLIRQHQHQRRPYDQMLPHGHPAGPGPSFLAGIF